jgi:uncharacterized damage-inducible protein DinB
MSQSEVLRIVDQLERGYRGAAWHGTPIRVMLAEVDAAMAAAAAPAGVHTIWQLTAHMTTWLNVSRRRAAGEAIDPTGDEDWPTITDSSAAAWAATLAELDQAFQRLVDVVRGLEDGDLLRQVPGRKYNHYVLLHGVLQHTIYHGGQVALLARAARERG